MKIVAISDTHGSDFVEVVPSGDLLLIAGDISPVRLDHSFYAQQQWFNDTFVNQLEQLCTKFKHIVFIGGNHDTYLSECNISRNNDVIRNVLPNNVYYLCDNMITINGVKIWGSPWCNIPKWARFGPPVWNFAANEEQLTNIYSKIPNDIDILLTHGPAFGFNDEILDSIHFFNENDNNTHLGSKSLIERIVNGINAKYVISGHIHSAKREYSVYKKQLEEKGIKFSCVSILDESYKFNKNNKPLIFDIDETSKG